MSKWLWILGGLGVVLCVVIICVAMAISGFNKARRYDEGVNQAWAQVDTVLKRRYDLIPNLVETVKGYAGHEKEIIEKLAEARTRYFSAGTPEQRMQEAPGIERALSRLLSLQETYPDLKANQNFLQLMDELSGTENRIAVERGRYNESVKDLNSYCRTFPGSFFASMAGVRARSYFEITGSERETPKVNFGK